MNARVFRLEMEMHRERVRSLAAVVLDLIPRSRTEARAISPAAETALFGKYMQLHDAPKIQSLHELSYQGYRHSASIADRLAGFYGLGQGELSVDQGRELTSVIVELNQLEVLQKQDFFKQNDLSLETRERYARAEMIADVTDTGVSRQDEMGLSRQAYNGYRFLIARADLHGAELSRWLEDNYGEILKQQLS